MDNDISGTSGWGFSLVGQEYLVAGYWGVFLVTSFYASTISLFYNLRLKSIYFYVFYIMLYLVSVYIIRADVANFLLQSFKIFGLAILLFIFLFIFYGRLVHMGGRRLFRMASFGLKFLSLLFQILPRSLAGGLWFYTDFFPGFIGVGLRYSLARRLAKNIGDNVYFGRRVEISNWDSLVMGTNVTIHTGCYIDARGGVFIGDDVSIAHSTSILSFEHSWDDSKLPIKYNSLVNKPVYVDSDVWIGCGCRILSGVSLSSRTIVAAGAVVTKNVEFGSVVGGVPAKKIMSTANE